MQHKNFLVTDGSLVNLSLRYGKFTSCDITVRETSVDNKVLRVPLERYDFTGMILYMMIFVKINHFVFSFKEYKFRFESIKY